MRSKRVCEIQKHLKRWGFNPGPIDGEWGPLTSRAVIRFKKAAGLRARDYVGPITLGALRKKKTWGIDKAPNKRAAEPIWLRRARQEIGVAEIPGRKHSMRVLSYWELAKLSFNDDETPWCAGFVCAMLEDCGITSTRSGMARSFNNWGREIKSPVPGCIVVFWRGNRNGSSGHVGFVTSVDQRARLMTLGGNQSNAVNIKPFSQDRVLSYRWPMSLPLPDKKLRKVKNFEKVSVNEA